MQYRTMWVAAVLGLCAGCGGQSMQELGGNPSPRLADGDNDFFKTITVANETEIQMSGLAASHSQNASVQDFAQHMIDDHRSAEGKVGSLAAEKGVALPSKLDSAHQDMVDDLKTKSGLEFDKAFIDDQVKAHKDTIEADKDEANSGTDPQVRALAGDLLGTLRMHLSMAEKLQNGM